MKLYQAADGKYLRMDMKLNSCGYLIAVDDRKAKINYCI
jgi:hypothetical protein